MLCVGCTSRVASPLCLVCRSHLRPGPEFVAGELVVSAGYHHRTLARRLVHRLKYQGALHAADTLAEAMVGRLPPGATALVPVPRAIVRRVRFGVDPAVALAARLAVLSGLPVVAALRPALWWPRHAVRRRDQRVAARFTAVDPAPAGAVLIDDVATSGATLGAARRSLLRAGLGDLRRAVTATSPGPH